MTVYWVLPSSAYIISFNPQENLMRVMIPISQKKTLQQKRLHVSLMVNSWDSIPSFICPLTAQHLFPTTAAAFSLYFCHLTLSVFLLRKHMYTHNSLIKYFSASCRIFKNFKFYIYLSNTIIRELSSLTLIWIKLAGNYLEFEVK